MKDFEVLMISVAWESRNKYSQITKSVRPLKSTLKSDSSNVYEYDTVIYSKEDSKYFQICIKTQHKPFLKDNDGRWNILFNLEDDLWIIKQEWRIGERGIGYHYCPSINTIGKIEIGIFKDLDNLKDTILIDVNSNIQDFDFQQLKDDFEGELWNLITSKKSKVIAERLELRYCDKIFRYAESKSIIDFLTAYDAIEQKPKTELLNSTGVTKIQKVKPIAETYRKLASVGSGARVLPSKTFTENYDIYENRYLCLMLYSVYQIVLNNIKSSQKQIESLQYQIKAKAEKIKVLNNPQVDKEAILQEIEFQEERVKNMEEEWQKISKKMSFDSHKKLYKGSIEIKFKHQQYVNIFGCKTEKTKFCLIKFPDDSLTYLTEKETYILEFSFVRNNDFTTAKGDTYQQYTITDIKKIEPQSERKILESLNQNKEKLELNNWVQQLTSRDRQERKNQIQTLEKDIQKINSQITNLSKFIDEEKELLKLIQQRIKRRFFQTVKWQSVKTFTPSMTFIQNIDYRHALTAYNKILESEGINIEVFDLYQKATTYGIREIPQVYELWCLVSIVKTLKQTFNFSYNIKDIHVLLKLINPENNNFNQEFSLKFGGNLQGRNVTLFYQKSLPNGKRPDFILEIKTDNRTIYLVLDAKFKNYNYKKSLHYEIKNLNSKYSNNDYYVFIVHPCNNLTNYGGDRINLGKEINQELPFHKYGYITHKPNFTDNLKKLIGMAFEYLLDFDTNGDNKANDYIEEITNNDNLFCLNCGSTKIQREPKTSNKKFTAKCQDCQHQTYINCCWNCATKLFKHGSYWDYHKTSVWSSFDIHCPKCGKTFADLQK